MLFMCPAMCFEISIDNERTCQRNDGTKLVDIHYSLSALAPLTGINIEIHPVTSSGETLMCATFIEPSDTGHIASEGEKHIVWDFGTDVPDREFYDDRVKFVLMASAPGIDPFHCTWPFCITFGGDRSDNGVAIERFPDSTYLIISDTRSFAVSDSAANILMSGLNHHGYIEWSNILDLPRYEYAVDLVANEDGSAIVYSYTNTFSDFDDILVFKISDAGDAVWGNLISSHRSTFEIASGMVEISDGSQLLCYNSSSSLCIVKINDDGVIEWATMTRNMLSAQPFGITPLDDGGFVVAYRTPDQPAVSKYDSDGNHIWSIKILYDRLVRMFAATELNDGNILVGGTLGDFDYNAFYLRISDLGELMSAKVQLGGIGMATVSAEAADDGGYYLAQIDSMSINVMYINPTDDLPVWSERFDWISNETSDLELFENELLLLGHTLPTYWPTADIFAVRMQADGFSCCSESRIADVRDITDSLTIMDYHPAIIDWTDSLIIREITDSLEIYNVMPEYHRICPDSL